MRPKAILVALGAVLAIAWSAAPAAAAPCGLPDSKPLWIDYAEGSVPFRNEIFGKPGVIAATSGTATPQALRERGARTVYWQMNIRNIVGTPLAPADPFSIEGQANALFDRAAASSACATPLIGLEELWGANLRTPWSSTNAQYRANVLTLVEVLTARGARPFLFVHGRPAVGGAAGEWWRTLYRLRGHRLRGVLPRGSGARPRRADRKPAGAPEHARSHPSVCRHRRAP